MGPKFGFGANKKMHFSGDGSHFFCFSEAQAAAGRVIRGGTRYLVRVGSRYSVGSFIRYFRVVLYFMGT